MMLAQLRGLTGSVVETSQIPNFSFLNKSQAMQAFGSQSQPLTTNTNFTLSQLPAMKSVLSELRGQLANLRDVPPNMDTAKGELREERRQYIEQRTQDHLQRHGQTMIGDAAMVGEKTIDPAEIEALEKITETLNQT